jgi:cobalt-zinc-cadmium efflux system membrane fusion protein
MSAATCRTVLRFTLLAGALMLVSGCGPREAVSEPNEHGSREAAGQGPATRHPTAEAESASHSSHEAGESAEHEPEALDPSVEEIFSEDTRCEHDIPHFTCAECRYELGVVKVSPELLASAGQEGFATTRVASRSMAESQELNGEVQLDEGQSVYIGPRAAGVVRRILVDVGQNVRAGQVLFEVESAELSDARAEQLKAIAAMQLAQATEQRESDLFEKKICAEKDLLEARAALEATRAAERAARERLLRLGLTSTEIDAVSPEGGGARSGLMPVRAPFAGTVLDRSLNLGALVEPGERNLLLADTSRVWVMTNVHERELGAILDQQARGRVMAEVSVPAFPGRVFSGTVDAVGGTVDEATRTTKARTVVDNPDGLLRRGMFARVRLRIETRTGTLAVPADAVLTDEGRSFVFVRHDAEHYVRRTVQVGQTSAGWTEVLSGLSAEAVVVSRGAFLLKSDVLRSKMGAGCAD